MFSLPIFLPSQWEKRVVRYIISRFDFLEERTLGDLSNLEGSLGRNSVLTLKDVGIKVDRVIQLAKLPIPPRLRIETAVIGTLTVTLPTNFLISGSIEVVISDVRVAANVIPAAPPTPPPSPRGRPTTSPSGEGSDDDRDDQDGGQEEMDEQEDGDGKHASGLPTSAEDLAESFLHSQPLQDQDQLLHSLYQDPLASSNATISSSISEDEEDAELGIGTSIGLPKILANVFKGVGDRLQIRVRGVNLSLEVAAPEDRGGGTIVLKLELEDLDVEGITNITPASDGGNAEASETKARRRREGKRRITLENIKGYITSDASLFEPSSPSEPGTPFGVASEVTERGMGQSIDTIAQSDSTENLEASTGTIRNFSPPPPRLAPSLSTAQTPPSAAERRSEEALAEEADEGVQVGKGGGGLAGGHRFAESEDYSSDEELAFAPTNSTNRTQTASRSFQPSPMGFSYDDDEDSEDEGGASFASGTLLDDDPPTRLPFASVGSVTPLPEPTAPQQDSYLSDGENSSGDDEMDAETSRLLSESTLFTHSEAGSLYMSATSGMLHSSAPLQRDEEMDRRKDEEDEEEVCDEEIDARLDKLLGTGAAPPVLDDAEPPQHFPLEFGGASAGGFRKAERRLRRKIFDLDAIEVFVPSLSDGAVAAPNAAGTTEDMSFSMRNSSNMAESSDIHIPGAFSMYAARSSRTLGPKPAAPSPPPKPMPRKPAVRIVDEKAPAPRPGSSHGGDKGQDVEVLIGNVEVGVDVVTARVLGIVLEAVTGALAEEPEEPKKKRTATDGSQPEPTEGSGLNLNVTVEEVCLRLVEKLAGVYIDEDEEELGMNHEVVLECTLRQIDIAHKSLAEKITTSKIDIKKFSLGDGSIDYLSFIRTPASTAKPKKRTSHPPSVPHTTLESDVTFIISQSPFKKRINIRTLPLKVCLDLPRLEGTLRAFGGFSGVLASTTASTATITKVRSNESPTRRGPAQEMAIVVDTKIDCKVGGLMVEISGTSAKVGLETSPLKIRSETGDHSSVSVSIDKIPIYGPSVPWDSPHEPIAATIMVENTRIEFLGTPGQEDLGRLLELLTPSKDRFEADDDILIDTLLRQREQGSLLRIDVGSVKMEIGNFDMAERLKELGGEIMKVLTVTDFVAQDERPGLLTLLNVNSFCGRADVGAGMGLIETQMDGIGVAHVSVPSLVALAITKISVQRNGEEELIGEGLERRVFDKADEGKPMVMVRIVGDDPEPVVKLKLWNLRAEYRVETLMSLMSTPENASAEALAQEVVQSIVNLAEERGGPDQTPPLGLDIVIKDCVLGLNPLNLNSRGLIVFTNSRLQAALPSGGMLSAGLEIRKASIMLVDDVANLVPPAERRESRSRNHAVGRPLAGYTAMGYVSVITISSARATLCVVEMGGANGEKAVDLDIRDDLLLIESCADSTQTLIGIANGLKPPLPESDEVKYCTEVMPIDMLRSLTEDAFVHPSRRKTGDPGFHMDDDDGDMVGDDVPLNLAFVESYYGHPTSSGSPGGSTYSKDELADSMLDEDLGEIAQGPNRPLRAGQRGMLASFTEQVQVLDESPLEIVEGYFRGPDPTERRTSFTGKRLNREAVNKWDSFRKRYVPSNSIHGRAQYFPLRIKVRDVHVIWNLHDGYDWRRTRDTINHAFKKIEAQALERKNRRVSFDVDDEDESVIGDFLFNSIYIGVPANRDPKDLASAINKNFDDHISETSIASSALESRPSSNSRNTEFGGGTRGSGKNLKLSRSGSHKMQFELKGVCVDFLLFPPDMGETQSSIDLRVRDLEIFDNVPTSTWRKFVTYMQDAGVRETGSNMVHLEIMNVKPVPELAASEIVLRVTVLPLRLHVDQDTLDFLTRFFEFKDDSVVPPNTPAEIPFLQRVEVNAIRVKLDYKPKKVDYAGLRSGHTTEFMNFFILEEADMVLRRVILYGISGFPRMGVELNDVWMPDIKQTQLGDVLAGVAPVRSIVNIGSGVKDLVVVPMREYRKDGRIVRSLQKGAWKFAKTTTSELVRLGAKVAVGTQNVLQNAEDFLVPTMPDDNNEGIEYLISDSEEEGDMAGPSEHGHGHKKVISLYADQPLSVAQGLRGAGDSLRRNFGSARDAIMAVPVDIAERGSAQGAAKAVARAAPVAIIRPMIGATEAVSRTLLGVTNALDPDQKRRVDDKYKKH